MLSSKVRRMWDTSVERISDTLTLPLTGSNSTDSTQRRRTAMLPAKRSISAVPKIVFVLSLAGRFQTFLRFLANYEYTCLMHPELMTDLLVVIFPDKHTDLSLYYVEINRLRRKHPSAALNHLTLQGNFSRGMALNNATHSAYIDPTDIIFFIDVDVIFKRTTIERIRLNTILNKQVYLPIVFSEYHPQGWSTPFATQTNMNVRRDFSDDVDTDLDNDVGYFRQFGYGICAIFKADIIHPAVNGFNTDIAGWGLEDVKFLEQLIKLNVNASHTLKNESIRRNDGPFGPENNNEPSVDKTQRAASTATPAMPVAIQLPALSIFRAPDPSLVHIYHDINCDKNLSESQYSMCLGTKASTLGSYRYIESIFMSDRKISDFVTSSNKIS